MKKCILLVMAILLISLFAGCATVPMPITADNEQAAAQEQLQKDMNLQTGLPNITNWTEKKFMKKVYEMRDDAKLVCYVYTKNEMTGKYIYEGRSMGYGLPYATQYSNPEKLFIEENGIDAGDVPYTMPQAEPNGLFMPTSADATWVMMINEDTGVVEVQYYENKLTITQTKKPVRLCEPWSLPKDY